MFDLVQLTVIDIAGLVRGAASGAGLGNAFLSHVRSVDAVYHLVRAFDNDDVQHVEDVVDPARDLEIIHEELRLKDEETLEKVIADLSKSMKGGVSDKLKKNLVGRRWHIWVVLARLTNKKRWCGVYRKPLKRLLNC